MGSTSGFQTGGRGVTGGVTGGPQGYYECFFHCQVQPADALIFIFILKQFFIVGIDRFGTGLAIKFKNSQRKSSPHQLKKLMEFSTRC